MFYKYCDTLYLPFSPNGNDYLMPVSEEKQKKGQTMKHSIRIANDF
ncbi:hypothetical protein KsCSTR_22470 [Candidatus Kuenenia stuttgartiensis]|jgi:hypothetical protein|uniref:Uncharacterized protein n=1 Tax=Kuenenia stuttgartiensis TaxID=174633 RepID=A0A6G7GQ02_KUEST|nr:hypothetical protein KsCSTR_22470 [Candidatus Kuenenia stuttgartiensis]